MFASYSPVIHIPPAHPSGSAARRKTFRGAHVPIRNRDVALGALAEHIFEQALFANFEPLQKSILMSRSLA
jgi:hypothetical protein